MKKAFIAGAVCPNCGKEDKIFVLNDKTVKVMHCASCGYKQDQHDVMQQAEKTPKAVKWIK